MIETIIFFLCKKDERSLKCWFPLVLGKLWIAKSLLTYQWINTMEELLEFLRVSIFFLTSASSLFFVPGEK